ncbi:MAG: 23S rRNA (adenine(2503)-C(2))-methyltransferase RlmN [Candidatus Omnitrophota bacterium]|jgi:23S rRNA (adenine2503-C2)-methyltransferase
MGSITELSLGELEHFILDREEAIFHAKQIFSWVYKKGAVDFDLMSNLPVFLRTSLKNEFSIFDLKLIKASKSHDGTQKFLFALKDDELIESVLIPSEKRITACISTQVGCKYACSFCASGIAGFERNLTSGEIIEEVLFLNRQIRPKKITHIVFMGTGEPLDNYDSLMKAVRMINSPDALGIGSRRITISTSGVIPGIERLAQEGLQIELSISLHSAEDKVRSLLMPVNRIYPLEDLIAACADFINKTGRQITFEYILIKGMNSSLESAQKLVKLLKELKLVKVNLIPANPVKELNIEPPPRQEIILFKDYLMKHGLHATLRKPRGEDIEAACGQLRLRHEKK